jgi:hypothetical protein
MAECLLAVCRVMEHIQYAQSVRRRILSTKDVLCHTYLTEEAFLRQRITGNSILHQTTLCLEGRLPPERRSCCEQRRECFLSKHTVTCDFRGVEFI